MPGLSNFPGTAIDSHADEVDGVSTIDAADVNGAWDAAIAAQTKIGVDADPLSAPTLEGRTKLQEAGGLQRGDSVASATSITLTDDAQLFPITGTTPIATIVAPTYPRLVYLEFASALTLTHGSGNLTLPGAVDMAVPAGTVLALEWTGATWRVAGGAGSGDASSLQGTPVDAAAPDTDNVLAYDGSAWAPAALTDLLPADPSAATPGLRTLGSGAQQAAAGTDPRFTDARPPTAHATSHVTVGQDPLPTFTTTTRGLVAPPGGTPSGAKYLNDLGVFTDPAITAGGMSDPMTAEDDLMIGDTPVAGVAAPKRLAKGTDGQVVGVDPSDHHVKYINVPSKHVIYDETSPVADQPVLAFQGSGVTVTDDALDGATIVTIPGGSSASVFGADTDGLAPGPNSGSGEDDADHVLTGAGTWRDVATIGGGGGGSSLGQLAPLVPPSHATTLPTWVNQGSATATDQADGLYLAGPASSSGGDLHCLVHALTPGRKTTLGFLPNHAWANFITVGLVITDGTSATDGAIAFGLIFNSGWAINVVHYADINSTGTADYTETPVYLPPIIWLQVDDTDGTNLLYQIGPDGENWRTIFSATRLGILTPSHVGIFVSSNLSSKAPAMKAVHWSHV